MNLIREKMKKGKKVNKDWIVVATVRKEYYTGGKKNSKETKELAGSYETYEKAREMADKALDIGFYIPYSNRKNPGQSHRRVIPSEVEVVNTQTKGGQNG